MTDFFAPAARGVQHASLRAANRRAVLTAITINSGLSNAELSRMTGLAPQTASAIVAELEAEGFVSRGEVLRGRRGQPATPLFLNFDALYSIGCEITWERINVTLIDLGSREIARYRRYYTYPDATTIVEEAARAIGEMLDQLNPGQRERLAGVGLSSPGAIAQRIGLLGAPATQSRLWRELDLRGALEDATGVATNLINNGNAACFGEMTHLPPPRPADYAYLLVDTFLSAGVVSDHTLWEGRNGNAANLGGILVCSREGDRVVAHSIASTLALRRRLAEAGHPAVGGDPSEWPWDSFGRVAEKWLADTAFVLAQVVFNTAVVTDIGKVVVDGVMPRPFVERLLGETEKELRKLAPLATAPLPSLQQGVLGGRAVAIGAAQMPIFRRYFSRDYRDILL